MSEKEDNANSMPDSQETFYDKSQNISNSQMLNESQDFALVVADDSDENKKTQSETAKDSGDYEAEKDNLLEKNVIQPETQTFDNDPKTYGIDKETQNVLSLTDKRKEDDLIESSKTENDDDNLKSRDKKGSDEEEIIQATPPEASPPRKLLSGITATKRRAESIDEPIAKIQRTVSQRDALKLDREITESQKDKESKEAKLTVSDKSIQEKESQFHVLCYDTEPCDDKEESETHATQTHSKNIVIKETQDSEDSEPIVFNVLSDHDNAGSNGNSDESAQKNEGSLDHHDAQLVVSNNEPNSCDSNNGTLSSTKKEDAQPTKKVSSEISDTIVKMATNGEDSEKVTENSDNDKSVDIMVIDSSQTEIGKKKSSEKKDDNASSKVSSQFNAIMLPVSSSASDSSCEVGSNSSNKSRKSVEVIYDRKSSSQEKKRRPDFVQLDEEGEKVVLDSSNEDVAGEKIVLDSSNEDYHLRLSTGSPKNTTDYKSCIDSSKTNSDLSYKSVSCNEAQKHTDATEMSDYQMTNGDEDAIASDTTKTVSAESDQFIDYVIPESAEAKTSEPNTNVSETDGRFNLSQKLNDTLELVNVANDSEGDSLLVNENIQNKSPGSSVLSPKAFAGAKITTLEKKTRFYIEMKYLLHINDSTKEIVSKEVTDVHCEPCIEPTRVRRNSDTSGCLADISGNANKDNSPGSVVSNPQLFQLPLSRLSIASTLSSSSSISSATALAVKLSKDSHFQLPKGRAKYTRKPAIDAISEEKLNIHDGFDNVFRGWKNTRLISDALLQSANNLINLPDIFQLDGEPTKIEDKVISSTPEPVQGEEAPVQVVTPKSTKNKKPQKRTRTKSNSTPKNNGMRNRGKISPEVITTSQENRHPIFKKKRENVTNIQSEKLKQIPKVSTPTKLSARTEMLRGLTPQNSSLDQLVGKVVFAKWSDNNYYPGEVAEKLKDKYRVKFYDGKTKLLIEDFIIPMPNTLRKGLSVYATTKEDNYDGSMGIIVESENVENVTYYMVEMDNGKRVKVQTKDIFLMPGQAQILKEEVDVEFKNLSKTPQHLGQVSLDNLVDGKRRSRRAATPTVSTPKSRKNISPRASRITDNISPSGSGVPQYKGNKREILSSESETKGSDSNISVTEDVDGVQPELSVVTTTSKGPSTRVKGKGRTRSKQTSDDVELGPMPSSSMIFKNMSFILTCTSSDIISRHHTDDSFSETGTENEEEWMRVPFLKDRVKKQLISGGGTVYDSFKLIPQSEYKKTKLITNVPNLTAKSIQCLSVGILTYSHNWVIHCCKENKALNPAPYELPAGWSLERKKYIESYDRTNKRPFDDIIIGIPMPDNRDAASRSIQFWSRICENAGAEVQLINEQETELNQMTAIMTDNRCPSWLVEKADNLQIPLVTTVWIVQCIIEGRLLFHDSHPQYKHTFIQS